MIAERFAFKLLLVDIVGVSFVFFLLLSSIRSSPFLLYVRIVRDIVVHFFFASLVLMDSLLAATFLILRFHLHFSQVCEFDLCAESFTSD